MRKYKNIADVINLIMFFIILVVPTECFRFFLYERGAEIEEMRFSPALELSVVAVLVVSFLAREGITRFWVYLLVHLPVLVILWFVGGAAYGKYVGLFIAVLFFISDIVYWKNQPPVSMTQLHQALVLIPVAVFAVSLAFDGTLARDIAAGGSVVYFLLYYMREFFLNAGRLAQTSMGTDNTAFSKMIRGNLWMAVPVIIVLLVTMLAIDTKVFADRLMHILEAVIKWFFGLFSVDEVPELTFDVSGSFSSENPMEVLPRNEDSWITVLYNVLFIILAIVIFSGLIYAVVRLLKQFFEEFGKREIKRYGQSEDIPGSFRETIEVIKKDSIRDSDTSMPSIRKKYKKQIKNLVKRGYEIDKTHTPKERATDVFEKKNVDIEELTAEYQRSRYSEI